MKILIFLILLISTIFASNTIELTGKYSKGLGNPYRVLLEKKNKKIAIYSENKNIEFNVISNLDNRTHLYHPKKFIFKNKTIENVLENYYGEEYEILHKKGNVELNVLFGKVFINYVDDSNQINQIRSIEVELDLEFKKNNSKEMIKIKLDDTLEIDGDNYNWTIRKTFDFSVKSINKTIQEIIEHIIYRKVLKDK